MNPAIILTLSFRGPVDLKETGDQLVPKETKDQEDLPEIMEDLDYVDQR